MAILIVNYDLISPGQKYQVISDWIKKNFAYCKHMESMYLIDTTWSTAQVRDGLKLLVDSNDRVLVARLASQNWASFNFGCAEWLNDNRRNW